MRLLTLATSRIIQPPSQSTTLSPNTNRILGRTAACALLLSSTHCCCAGLQTRSTPFGAAAFLTTTSSPSTAKFLKPTTFSPRRTATSIRMATSNTRLTFGPTGDSTDFDTTVIVGKKDQLKKGVVETTSRILGFDAEPAVVTATLGSIRGKSGAATTFLPRGDGDKKPHRLSFCALPDKVSRCNHPMSVHTITSLVQSACPDGAGNARVVVMLDDGSGSTSSSGAAAAGPLASAVAKSFPLYSRKTGDDGDDDRAGSEGREVRVTFLGEDGATELDDPDSLAAAEAVSEGVRLAARLTDTPPEELTTAAYAEECRGVVKKLKESGVSIKMTEIVGEELRKRGYGGLYGVGKAAACPPRMIIMEYEPPGSAGGDEGMETVALVGKGIVYDTGGLALKPKVGMCGMKHDMGGSAGMLGGFYAAAKLRARKRITLILCVAENAIGPDAFRNDDILTLYSGKTVEINNSDAEGRLVLGDGVAHATKNIKGLDLVMDMATLTGAQMVTTGQRHGAVLANTAPLEGRALSAGMHSGDLCHPLLYAPELLMDEFKSKVADMKNSVKDRGNAQSSCAGHFIESHLDKDYEGGWLHVDMAGPSTKDERGTGYGVGLVLSLLEAPGF